MRVAVTCAWIAMLGCGARTEPKKTGTETSAAGGVPEAHAPGTAAEVGPPDVATTPAGGGPRHDGARPAQLTPFVGRWATAGADGARYRFPIPDGFLTFGAVINTFGNDRVDFDAAHPGGVGLPDPAPIKPNSIVVYSDPLGLGGDASRGPVPARVLAAYDEFVHQRFPTAAAAKVVTIGPWRAIASDMPEVVISGRPDRSGRSYLILDGTMTATVDCLWLPARQDLMRAACDLVAAHLEPVPAR